MIYSCIHALILACWIAWGKTVPYLPLSKRKKGHINVAENYWGWHMPSLSSDFWRPWLYRQTKILQFWRTARKAITVKWVSIKQLAVDLHQTQSGPIWWTLAHLFLRILPKFRNTWFRGVFEPSPISAMELFAKIVIDWLEALNYFRKKSAIVDVRLDSQYTSVWLLFKSQVVFWSMYGCNFGKNQLQQGCF